MRKNYRMEVKFSWARIEDEWRDEGKGKGERKRKATCSPFQICRRYREVWREGFGEAEKIEEYFCRSVGPNLHPKISAPKINFHFWSTNFGCLQCTVRGEEMKRKRRKERKEEKILGGRTLS